MKRAWRTTWGGIASIVAATSRGQAISRTLNSAKEAGYQPRWQDVKAARAPEFDCWAAADQAGYCRCEEGLPK